MLKNLKKLYQFNNYLTHQPNQKGSYTVAVKDNSENSRVNDGNFSQTFYDPKFNSYIWKADFEINTEFGINDLDFILHEWNDKNSNEYSVLSSRLKKVFWINNDCNNTFTKPRVYFNYGYADSTTINYSEDSDTELKISTTIKTLKPFFFECTRDLFLLDKQKLNELQLYGYDWNAYYDSTQVYDFLQDYLIDINNPNLTVKELNDYFDCCSTKQNLLLYKDFFNLSNSTKRDIQDSIATRRDNQTLIIPLDSLSITTSTDRSAIILGNPYPINWTGGKLDLNTSRKSEVMVIELDIGMPTNYWFKITNLVNGSSVKLTWKATTNNGQSGNIQFYPHTGQVWANGLLANPFSDYTLEVDNTNGCLYFDSLYKVPNLPIQLTQLDSQNIVIEQSSMQSNTLYIQTLKTFY